MNSGHIFGRIVSIHNWTVVLEEMDYCLPENGLTAYKMGKPLPSETFITFIGEERYKTLVNFILHYIADLDIPIKRSGFLLPQTPCLLC